VRTLVVGAGFSGATIARRLHDAGQDVHVIDRRTHIGGTAYDFEDEWGVRISSHGAHLFHTNAPAVSAFLSRFTDWVPFEHKVVARSKSGIVVPMPVNRTTINRLFGLELKTVDEVLGFYAASLEPTDRIENAEQQVTSRVGRVVFEELYERYTLKQWGRPASELSSYVTGRLPVRLDDDDRYFDDDFQAQPKYGWTALFGRMLTGIRVDLGVDFLEMAPSEIDAYDRVVYTGPVDEFFDHRLGRLPWRGVRFEHHNMPGDPVLPVGVVNYCGDEPYTRRIEWRQLTGQVHSSTTISTEFPDAEGEEHYPVPCRESWDLHAKYRELAAVEAANVVFAGRLGSYRYMTMDQTVAQALKTARSLLTTSEVLR
jgi:UDP-galactopyranose mutase